MAANPLTYTVEAELLAHEKLTEVLVAFDTGATAMKPQVNAATDAIEMAIRRTRVALPSSRSTSPVRLLNDRTARSHSDVARTSSTFRCPPNAGV